MRPAERSPRRRPGVPPEPEAQFQQAMIDVARALGWLASHTYDSRHSEPGFPDVVFVHPRWGRVLFVEFKTERGDLTTDQRRWGRALLAAGAEWRVWRPSDKETAVETLTHRTARVQSASAERNQEASL